MLPGAVTGRLNARNIVFLAVRARPVSLGAFLTLVAAGAADAQTPAPTPLPQDQLTLQARSNVVQGSGARALGMGGAFLARADDATAASWNPAGLSYLRLPEVSFVYSGGNFDSQETNSVTMDFEKDHRHGRGPEFLAATYPLQIGPVSGSAQLSYQRLISFTSDRTIDESFFPAPPDEPFTRQSTITSRGGYDVLALGSGWQLTRTLRAGVTLNRWFNGYDQTYDRPVELGISHQEFHYSLRGWNANLGLIWTPTETLNIGLVYKTGFTAELDIAKLRMDPFPVGDQVVVRERQASSDDLGLRPTLEFPAAIGVGASVRPFSALTLSVDYTRTRWSKGVIRNFFDLPKTGSVNVFDVLPYPTLDPALPQADTAQIRAGVEYVFIRGPVKWPLRVGYFNDKQYYEAFNGPPQFDAFTAGTGLIAGPVLFDVAYILETDRYPAVSISSHRLIGSVILRLPRR
jgi:long-subunit fatty acid transport protein